MINDLAAFREHFDQRHVKQDAEIKTIKQDIEYVKLATDKLFKTDDLDQTHRRLQQLLNNFDTLQEQRWVLDSLRYPLIKERESHIHDASQHTFTWLYEPDIGFQQWLETGDDIFWIKGKPGSGKSTLIKWLYSQPQTMTALRAWAKDENLITASHYFWNPGTDIQKSQIGLLRALLYDVFRAAPNLIQSTIPTDPSQDINVVHWTPSKLLKAFGGLQKNQQSRAKFCFFIDGLDEYVGDHVEFTDCLFALAASHNIKLCVSSRPWQVFELSFETSPKLTLEDHTNKDIERFVSDRLQNHRFFMAAQQRNPKCHELVQEIIERSKGVFLWVFFVVNSLLRGLPNADSIDDLFERLRELPTELEEYFLRMLNSTDRFYHRKGAEILQICSSAIATPFIPIFAFLSQQEPNFALQEMPSWSDDEFAKQNEELPLQVRACCRDLIEVYESSDAGKPLRVGFLHRTVRDFLRTRPIQDLLGGRVRKSFDAVQYLCNANLALIKCMKLVKQKKAICYMDDFLSYASTFEHRSIGPTLQLCTDFERSVVSYFSGPHAEVLPAHYRLSEDGVKSQSPFSWLPWVAVQRDLPGYVRASIDAGWNVNSPHANSYHPPLLLALDRPAAKFLFDGRGYREFRLANPDSIVPPDLNMLKLLIEAGADVNLKTDSNTVWGYVLLKIHKQTYDGEQAMVDELLVLFLSKGADMSLKLKTRKRSLGPPSFEPAAMVEDTGELEEASAIVIRNCSNWRLEEIRQAIRDGEAKNTLYRRGITWVSRQLF